MTARGKQAQMVLTDWQNTGTQPITCVHARITAYGPDGEELSSGAPDYVIFATEKRPIQPGETYHEPDGDGFVLFPYEGMASRVDVAIIKTH
jgi:hypothetical protein